MPVRRLGEDRPALGRADHRYGHKDRPGRARGACRPPPSTSASPPPLLRRSDPRPYRVSSPSVVSPGTIFRHLRTSAPLGLAFDDLVRCEHRRHATLRRLRYSGVPADGDDGLLPPVFGETPTVVVGFALHTTARADTSGFVLPICALSRCRPGPLRTTVYIGSGGTEGVADADRGTPTGSVTLVLTTASSADPPTTWTSSTQGRPSPLHGSV